MNALKCQRCGADIPVPDLPAEVKKKISAVAHRTGRIRAVLELRGKAKIGLGEAKAVAFHLSEEGGVCHWCRTRLTEQAEDQNCPKCRSLNLRW
jgi:ribosomal protein L40E